MIRYADFHLDDATAAALAELVESICEQVLAVLHGAGLVEPVCSVCLHQGQEEDLNVLPRIFAGRASDRARILAEDPSDWAAVWEPFSYRDEEDVIHPSFDEETEEETYLQLAPTSLAAWRAVRSAVTDRVEEPSYWVLGRVARQLNRTALPGSVTDDVTVYLDEPDHGQGDLIEQLTFVLSPEKYAYLEAAGLIGEDEEATQ